jgi:predicted kinase
MSRMWILCGLSFSGKSTLARRLATEHGAEVVSLDAINEERGVGHGGDGLPVSVWGETLDLALKRVDDLLASGRDVVMDDTACYRWMRDRFREVAARRGAEVKLLFLDTPLAEIARRRAAATDRRGITDAVFDEHLRTFERPGEDEGAEVVLPGIRL